MRLSNCMLRAFVCVLVLVSVVGSEPVARGDSTYATGGADVTDVADAEKVVFVAVDVYIDSGKNELGVYQIEIKAIKGNVKVAGVEGGEHKAFEEPPYYDTAAMKGGRIILAAFSTQDDLPTGKTKVATVHMQVTGDVAAEYEVIVIVVGDGEGKEIDATVTVE